LLRSLSQEKDNRSGRAVRGICSEEMSIGKNLAGTALQVAFEVSSFALVGEGEVADQSPGAAEDRRLVLSGIVTGESRAKVVGKAGVMAAVINRTLQKVYVVHDPSSARWSGSGKAAEYPNLGVAHWRELVRRIVACDSVED